MKLLNEVLRIDLCNQTPQSNDSELLGRFLTAKEVEGCSPRTIAYYESTLTHMIISIDKPYTQVDSDDLRQYLNDYETE